MLLLNKLMPNFKSIQRRDDFIILILSLTLIIWLSCWLVPHWTSSTSSNANFAPPVHEKQLSIQENAPHEEMASIEEERISVKTHLVEQ